MSLSDELIINNLIAEAAFYINHQDENESFLQFSQDSIDKIDHIIKKNIRDSFISLSPELIISFCETSLLIPDKSDLAQYYIDLFFQRNTSFGQFYIRALYLKARLTSMNSHSQLLKGEQMITSLTKSLSFVAKALEVIQRPENKIKYGFLVYNASVCVYHIIRPMLKPHWEKFFVEIIEKIDKMFEEVDEVDYNWRCRFSWLLFHCLFDADKKVEAFKVLEKLWVTAKNKDCDFLDSLLRLRLHMGKENKNVDAVAKEADAGPKEKAWSALQVLQRMKSGHIVEAQVEKELINLINTISSAVLPGNEIALTNRLAPVNQERLAEAGRVALYFNLVNIADSITNFLNRVRQLHLRAHILHEYNKAELYIKKAGPLIDNKTGMRLNSVQIKMQEVERRIEALKLMEKVMITNKKQNDPDLIIEGAVLVWNISLPFLNAQYRQHVYKAFQSACALLEQLQSIDHALRVNFHIELAKTELQEDFAVKAEAHIRKALSLDYSIPMNKVQFKIDEDEDISLYQRPYDKYLNNLKEKIKLKQNIYADPKNEIERVILNLESASLSKSENMRIDILQKCLGAIVNLQEQEYIYDPQKDLVEEEINNEKVIKKQQNLYQYKQKKLLAGEIAKTAFEWELNDLAIKACEFVCSDVWDQKNSSEMILIQAECFFRMAQILIDNLIKENFEIAFAEPIKVDDSQSEQIQEEEMSQDKKDQVLSQKRKMCGYFLKGLKLADSIKQTWLVFNGAIYIWNNFLPIFRNPINDNKLLSDITNLLKEFFEIMKNSLKEIEKKQINDYDIDTKIQVLANIGLIYARLMEGKSQYDEVMRVCEALLLTPLSPHTRKLINSIKARVSGVAKTGAGTVQKGAGEKAGKGVSGKQAGSTSSDSVLFDVVSQLEIIQNSTNKAQTQDLIKKCFETLQTWTAKENDETELELHAELWARLARLALNEENALMYKYSLRSVQNSLYLLPANSDLSVIPPSRLRWYSLAEYIYSENLLRMLNTDTQETESQERLLFFGLKHAIEAANKGLKASINSLVLDASKQVWNICARLEESAQNRKHLIKPVFTTLFYLKECKEKSEPDLILLLAQLLFKSALENDDFKLGEQAADMIFELIPKNMQKPVWEAKMIFMSKQGKNELQAISNMKEADASLQAKVWIRLARASNNLFKQYTAYNKAIEILKKEGSVEIVEVLIEFSEWLLRNGNEKQLVVENLNIAADTLFEIEMDDDEEDEEEEIDEEQKSSTIFSRSTRGKKSTISRASKAKSKVTKKSQKNTIKSSKKLNEQKSQASGSKVTANQRFSRAANVRTSKTIKSKQSKSIFTQREEEAQPEQLNCAHYERLLRIHSMLAMVAESMEEQVQYALDGKVFLIKIVEISFKTLNQMEENASKYTNIIDEKTGKQANQPAKSEKVEEFVPKYLMPQNIEEWIKLNFSKEFIEKVISYEDYNFMGKYLFEKAQLTYTYINQLIKIFENYGLQVHCIPLYVFQRFFVKEILGNQQLQLLIDIKFARCLHLLGFHVEADVVWNTSGATKFKLSEHEKKHYLAKTESSIVLNRSRPTADISEHNLPQPYIISEIFIYQVWSELGRELILWGESVRAKDILKEAYQHAKIVQDLELMGDILISLGQLSFLEGEYKESLESFKLSHKMIKNVLVWENSATETYKSLCKLGRFDDIKAFLKKMTEVFIEVLNKPQYIPNKLQIYQTLGSLYILQGKVYLKELFKEFQYDLWKSVSDNFEKAIKCISHGGYKTIQVDMILTGLNKLLLNIRGQNYSRVQSLGTYMKVFSRMTSKMLVPLEQELRNLLKYTLLIEREGESIKSPLMHLHAKVKVLLAAIYTEMGLIKYIRRQENLPELGTGDDTILDDEEDLNLKDDEGLEQVHALPKYGPLQKYLAKLTYKIERALQPLPQRLESFEKGIAILISCERHINKDCFWWTIAQIELARAKRLLAMQKGQLKSCWTSRLNKQQQDEQLHQEVEDKEEFDYKSDALSYVIKLTKEIESQTYAQLKKNEQKGNPVEWWIFQNKKFYTYLKMLQEQFVELIGQQIPELAYEYLSKFQHYSYCEQMLQMVKQAFFGKHKFVTLIRYNKLVYQSIGQNNNEIIQLLTNESYRLWNNIMTYPDYKEVQSQYLPYGCAFVILQQSQNKQYLYLGSLVQPKQSQSGKTQDKRYQIERIPLTSISHDKIDQLRGRLIQIKSNLVKTPIIQESDLIKLEDEMETEYNKVFREIEEFFSFVGKYTNQMINQEQENKEEILNQPIDPKKPPAKPADKGAKKTLGKDELGAYESILDATPGGVEALVLLLDTTFNQLPLEYLETFSQIPAISRDFSILFLGRRLKSLQYQPALNNAVKYIEKDKIKYVTYDFKEEDQDVDYTKYNSTSLFQDFSKTLPPQFKLEGTNSQGRLCSLGELQKYSNTGSAFIYYGSPGILNILTPKVILDLTEINNVRFWAIFDKMNARKTMIEKYTSLDPDGEKTPILEQSFKVAAFLSLIDVSAILTTQWAPHTTEFLKALDSMVRGMTEDVYLSSTLKKYKESQLLYFNDQGVQLDPLLVEQSRQAINSKDQKKSIKQNTATNLLSEDELKLIKEVRQPKKRLHKDNFIYYGVPVLRTV